MTTGDTTTGGESTTGDSTTGEPLVDCDDWDPTAAITLVSDVYHVDIAFVTDLLVNPEPLLFCDDIRFVMQSWGFEMRASSPGQLFYELGLREYDIPLYLNGYSLTDVGDVLVALGELWYIEQETEYELVVLRNNRPLTLDYSVNERLQPRSLVMRAHHLVLVLVGPVAGCGDAAPSTPDSSTTEASTTDASATEGSTSEACTSPDMESFEGEHFIMRAEPGLELCGGTLRHMDDFIARLSARFDVEPPGAGHRICYAWLYESNVQDYCKFSESVRGCAPEGDLIVASIAPLNHEFVHNIAYRLAGRYAPAFLVEGLAVAHQGFWRQHRSAPVSFLQIRSAQYHRALASRARQCHERL